MAASNKNLPTLPNLGGRKLSSDAMALIASGAKQDKQGYLVSKGGQAVMDPKKQPKPIHPSPGPNSSADYNALVGSGAKTDARGFLTGKYPKATASQQAAAKRALKAKQGVGAVRTANTTGSAKKAL